MILLHVYKTVMETNDKPKLCWAQESLQSYFDQKVNSEELGFFTGELIKGFSEKLLETSRHKKPNIPVSIIFIEGRNGDRVTHELTSFH